MSLTFLVTPQALAACLDTGIISVDCGKTPSSTFDNTGRLWTVFVQGKHAYLSHSSDKANTYSKPLKINQSPEEIYTNGENRPKIAIDNDGIIYTTWTQKTAGRFTGDIRFTRSVDNGQSFEKVRVINDDGLPIGHRFDELFITPSGTIYIAWLDKRNRENAKKEKQTFKGISLFYTVSTDKGKTFSKNMKTADHSCECCRLSMTSDGENDAKIFWRHMFNKNTRDHAIATLSPDGVKGFTRATIDDWQTDACPHHGPDIAIADDGDYHLTWFSNGTIHKGIYYGRFDSELNKTVDIMPIDRQPSASHPQVKQVGNTIWLVWKRFENNQTHLKTRHSHDGGKYWSKFSSIQSTAGASDHPLFIENTEGALYIAWLTTDEGYTLIPTNSNAKHVIQIATNEK